MTGKDMIIDGIAASEAIDSSGEILDVAGCDITDFNNGTAILNWEHSGSGGHKDGKESPIDIIGKIIYGKKIFKQSDCDDERQLKYWNQCKLPFIYMKARLYDGAGHPGAMAAAAMIRDHVAHDEKVLLRYSIEGSTLDRKDNRLLRSVARRVAATIKPCNRSCDSGIISDPNGGQPAVKNVEALAEGLLGSKKEQSTKKFENPMAMTLGGYEQEWSFESMDKTMTAGMPTGAPSTLTQGDALQVSDISSRKKRIKDKLKKAILDKMFEEHGMTGFLDVFMKAEDDDEPSEDDEEIELDEPEDMVEPTESEADSIKNATVKIIRRDSKGKLLDKPLVVDGASYERFKPHSIAYAAKKKGGPAFAPAAGIYFDSDTGVLHTGKASFPMYIPRDEAYMKILNSPEINGPHDEAMKHWTRLHEILHKGQISPEVMMYASIFSGLSPNNPVPMQEYAFSQVVDMFKQGILNVDNLKRLYDPELMKPIVKTGNKSKDKKLKKERAAKIKELLQSSPEYQEFQRRVQGKGYHNKPKYPGEDLPEHSREYYAGQGGASTRYGQPAGQPPENAANKKWVPESGIYQKGLFGPFGKFQSISGYGYIKPLLEELVNKYTTSGRSVARALHAIVNSEKDVKKRAGLRGEIEELRDVAAPIEDPTQIFVQGFAPKTIRYKLGMMGFGDMLVPDTHLTRHLFDLERDKVIKAKIAVGMQKLSMDPNANAEDRALAMEYLDRAKKPAKGEKKEKKGEKGWQEFLPHSHVRSIMWNAAAHDEMTKLDDYYERNHPAIKLTAKKIFGDEKKTHHAIFPGFWLHWLTINPHEAIRKGVKYKGTYNAGTHHVPFFMLIDELHKALGYAPQTDEYRQPPFSVEAHREQLAREHEKKFGTRIPQIKIKPKKEKVAKSEILAAQPTGSDLAKLLTANGIIHEKLGEGYGNLYYMMHVLPKLLDMDQKIQKSEKDLDRDFYNCVKEWGQKNPGWVPCEDISDHVAEKLKAMGHDAQYITGEASYFDHEENEEMRDFHAWVQVGNRILDPKEELLKLRGHKHHLYWDHAAENLDIDKKEKKSKAKETEGSWSGGKQDHGMPEVADKFIDTFEEIADDLKPTKKLKEGLKMTKKSEKWFQDLYTMKDLVKSDKADPSEVSEDQLDERTHGDAKKMVVGMKMTPKAVKGISQGKGITDIAFWTDGADGKPVFVKGEHDNLLNGAATEAATVDLAHQLGIGSYFPKVALVHAPEGRRAVIEGIVGMHDPGMLKSEDKSSLVKKQNVEDIQKLALFDAICKNNDRRFGNYGYRPDGNIVMLDHADNFAPSNYGFDSLMPEYLEGVDSQAKPSTVKWLNNIDIKKFIDTLDHYGIIEDQAHKRDIVEHIADLKAKVENGTDIKLMFDGRG